MASKRKKVIPQPVSELRVQIDEWRGSKDKKHRMPKKLWEESARLAKRYGVSLVAEGLALGYTSLKQKAHGNWDPVKKKSDSGVFVDATPPPISTSSMMSFNEIELHRPDGHWVVIRNADSNCVSKVAGMFFEQGR